jgi:hypothetical protein
MRIPTLSCPRIRFSGKSLAVAVCRFTPNWLLALLLAGFTCGPARAHPDPPGPPALEDQIKILEIMAESDQDDGINGESEYILRITIKHPGHAEADSELLMEFNVDWDAKDPDTGVPYDMQVPLRLPLVGKNGFASDAVHSHVHFECTPSAPWEVTMQLKESNNLVLADILKILGDAASKLGTNLPPVDPKIQGLIVIGGVLSGALGEILNKLFNNMENLGQANPTWNSGDGDLGDTNTVRTGDLFHFSYKAEKFVKVIPGRKGECESTNTPSSGETPEHTFGDDVPRAQSSWDYLFDATSRIDGIVSEPGTPNGPLEQAAVQQQRQAVLELVGAMGRHVAQVELEEAVGRPLLVDPQKLSQAQQQVTQGDSFKQMSIVQTNTALMFQALQLYRQAFTLLAHDLHETQLSAIDAYLAGSELVLNWQHGGTLQSAVAPGGPWEDIPRAISGFRAPVTPTSKYFRVVKRLN